MPWKYEAQDNKIDVVVEPDFGGDLFVLARSHPVWIVDTPSNRASIDTIWHTGKDMNLYEVSRCRVENPIDRQGNLEMILGMLDDHHDSYGIIVHGLQPDALLEQALQEQGFRVSEATSDGFAAVRIPGVREHLIGRH
jgi:hypothetical protein